MPENTNNAKAVTSSKILAANVDSYLDVLNVEETLVGVSNAQSVGVDLYVSTVDLYFSKANHSLPPRVVSFRATLGPFATTPTTLLEILPVYQLDYNDILNPLGTFTCGRYATATIYPDKVRIYAKARATFDENYICYVLRDKADATR